MDIDKARVLFKDGRYQDLINSKINIENADAQELIAYSYQKTGGFEEAMLHWNQLIQKLPEVAQFYNERGVCKFNLKFKHAIEDFNQAVLLEPENPYFFACRAYVKDKLGDSEGAVLDYQKAHDLDPSDAITLNNLGLAEQKLGHTAKAREFFKQSDDLLGIESRQPIESSPTVSKRLPSFKDKIKEVQRMLSSKSEIKRSLKEIWKSIKLN